MIELIVIASTAKELKEMSVPMVTSSEFITDRLPLTVYWVATVIIPPLADLVLNGLDNPEPVNVNTNVVPAVQVIVVHFRLAVRV